MAVLGLVALLDFVQWTGYFLTTLFPALDIFFYPNGDECFIHVTLSGISRQSYRARFILGKENILTFRIRDEAIITLMDFFFRNMAKRRLFFLMFWRFLGMIAWGCPLFCPWEEILYLLGFFMSY